MEEHAYARLPCADLDDDETLVRLAKAGSPEAIKRILKKYHRFIKIRSSSYFLAGGDADDLVQEGYVGLYKAIRDYRPEREASFRSFAELCVTRQIITAVKTASRQKHSPLNSYVSFSHSPARGDYEDRSLDELLPSGRTSDPVQQVISSEELRSLTDCLTTTLSELEAKVLRHYLEGRSYEEIADLIDHDTKTVDNALQRIKRKVTLHLESRRVS